MTIESLSNQSGIPKIKIAFYQDADLLPSNLTDAQLVDLVKLIDQLYGVGISLEKLHHYAHLQQKRCAIIAAQKTLLQLALQQLAEKQQDIELELRHLDQVSLPDDDLELHQIETTTEKES
ncbi:hypothetical protein AYR62_05435 [Secundilactobacillus paracollinoides]|uniref:hypothetical protein n=1 Tax=Secundilactobacillus paracollinoides TaxID=240427 RepID=UPI0006D07E7E|nr:hypothetical protein [Secundilactobacillus paracollinoides]ANZ63589.1 hypothetical protein AYR62_05435 [Secundilactobacillus paracollinoides]KRL79258.1 hypothetical protein FC17_GL000520 [Secundilactobacillus paracollinoides DSM 15502 = JCM 11969]